MPLALQGIGIPKFPGCNENRVFRRGYRGPEGTREMVDCLETTSERALREVSWVIEWGEQRRRWSALRQSFRTPTVL